MTTENSHYRGRFAPSPTGPLHFGSLLAAFGSWLLARHAGGQWLIRIEDIDPPREISGAADAQLCTLRAFGLESDEPVIWQSQRSAHYQAAIDQLLQTGKAFACHCSRTDLAESQGVHRHCVAQHQRAEAAIRLRVPDHTHIVFDDAIQGRIEQDLSREVGDVVLRRADGYWAYQLAVVVDDAAQGITDVVRGADLLDSTTRQIYLQQCLGLPTPRYAHLPLVVDAQRRKLSKSSAALPVDASDPLPTLRMAWHLLGQTPAVLDNSRSVSMALHRACADFEPARIPKRKAFDFAAAHNGNAITNH